ncbi:hypothetical protein [Rhizobium sp. RU36D]|uniref:hypothetical protein n=1 Tax=Rhizobium sp. RU36D TaxID=1907415 RepID=UPI0009D8FDB1|nr:hypothetical protein [Rhizobium sp. RU36D]SMD02759.1 hypothetical protein SAMN05880593_11638 [Rhizobium sp. RU36D]
MSKLTVASAADASVVAALLPEDAAFAIPLEQGGFEIEVGEQHAAALASIGADMSAARLQYVAIFKADLKRDIDATAETERLKYITPGAGQAMTYQAKASEARLYLADPSPDPQDYPLLAAEVGITAEDMSGVATAVLAAERQWHLVGAAIEAVRLGAKEAISVATTKAEADAVFAAITWPAAAS